MLAYSYRRATMRRTEGRMESRDRNGRFTGTHRPSMRTFPDTGSRERVDGDQRGLAALAGGAGR